MAIECALMQHDDKIKEMEFGGLYLPKLDGKKLHLFGCWAINDKGEFVEEK